LGETRRAIAFYEQALAIAREIGDKRGEGNRLGNLGNAYSALGETRRAIAFYEQALAIDREIGDKRGESIRLENTGHALLALNEIAKSIQSYSQAIQVADEINFPQTQNYARWGLALAHLYAAQINPKGLRDPLGLEAARAAVEAARQYDVPQNNHNVAALLGIIALRQHAVGRGGVIPPNAGDMTSPLRAAQEAFTAAIQHADALLAQTPEYYDALDGKGIALCGLGMLSADRETDKRMTEAVVAFRAARKINHDAGVVARAVRLLDALALAHPNGAAVLAEARHAAGG
jgi:tetratricopeptide (TPR) repeat protein